MYDVVYRCGCKGRVATVHHNIKCHEHGAYINTYSSQIQGTYKTPDETAEDKDVQRRREYAEAMIRREAAGALYPPYKTVEVFGEEYDRIEDAEMWDQYFKARSFERKSPFYIPHKPTKFPALLRYIYNTDEPDMYEAYDLQDAIDALTIV